MPAENTKDKYELEAKSFIQAEKWAGAPSVEILAAFGRACAAEAFEEAADAVADKGFLSSSELSNVMLERAAALRKEA